MRKKGSVAVRGMRFFYEGTWGFVNVIEVARKKDLLGVSYSLRFISLSLRIIYSLFRETITLSLS
jgi:uncharacterized membrane protein